ncbi:MULTISPECIES: hypothetical protein [Variovorax]|jgi:hypothetical protein|uniref:hypothetical protein n=1 Tax=Variovorax TaxID=34072 RepID=UPI002854D033|nr:hypothetical protein [Variovorax sp. 3319]MDR6887701.1 hypothetical protein [Variovorax sp. 3319]
MNRNHLNFPPPPVPRTVRELLKDYPELIEELQEALTSLHYGPRGPMDFERAVWLLKDMLGGDMGDAYSEEDRARARGDMEAARLTNKKAKALAMAVHAVYGDGDLSSYFKTQEKDFR